MSESQSIFSVDIWSSRSSPSPEEEQEGDPNLKSTLCLKSPDRIALDKYVIVSLRVSDIGM